jgi:cell division protein FtsB
MRDALSLNQLKPVTTFAAFFLSHMQSHVRNIKRIFITYKKKGLKKRQQRKSGENTSTINQSINQMAEQVDEQAINQAIKQSLQP